MTRKEPVVTIKIGHFIDGQEVESHSGRTFQSLNPATGELLAEVAFGEQEDVDRAVASSLRAFRDGVWTSLLPAERGRRMRKLAQLIGDSADELARLESLDTGKPILAARRDVDLAASTIEYFSQLPEHINGTVYASGPDTFVYSKREPYGVVGAIAPWNFPIVNAALKVGAPLAAGNCIVLKMAENTPITTARLAELAFEAGIPAGVLNTVHGDGSTTGAAIVAHPDVPKITFTGSTEVGRIILKAAADRIKSVHLELGGKSPNIVLADADLEKAVSGSIFTSYFNSGQICTSGSRLLISEERADEFLDQFQERAAALVVGNPLSESTHLGPVISKTQLENVTEYIKVGVDEGARLVVGGDTPTVEGFESGYFVNPTVFRDVQPTMRIAQEEIFGPVLSVLTFRDEAEAIRIANDVAFGLAATVWTNDLGRAFRMANELEAGIIWTNAPHQGLNNVPYEGHKISGLGEDKGLESMTTFTKLKVNYIAHSGPKMNWG